MNTNSTLIILTSLQSDWSIWIGGLIISVLLYNILNAHGLITSWRLRLKFFARRKFMSGTKTTKITKTVSEDIYKPKKYWRNDLNRWETKELFGYKYELFNEETEITIRRK